METSFLKNLTKLKYLNLRENKIEIISDLGELTQLFYLDISFNNIVEIPLLSHLIKLEELNLFSNKIENINFLGVQTQLKKLLLGSNKIFDISALKNLNKLETLDIGFNEISNFNVLINLINLSELDLGGNSILNLNFLENCNNLKSISLNFIRNCDLEFLGKLIKLKELDLSNNEISDYGFLSKLTELTHLNLKNNNLNDFDINKRLQLNWLRSLETIDFSNNEISNLQPFLFLLKKGMSIDLKEDHFWKLKNQICFKNNPINNPPIEILRQNTEFIINYFEKLEIEGVDYIYEGKLTLVGDGGAGKTSLQQRIINKNSDLPKHEERTRGIKVSNWNFKDKDDEKYTVNIWDFGCATPLWAA